MHASVQGITFFLSLGRLEASWELPLGVVGSQAVLRGPRGRKPGVPVTEPGGPLAVPLLHQRCNDVLILHPCLPGSSFIKGLCSFLLVVPKLMVFT